MLQVLRNKITIISVFYSDRDISISLFGSDSRLDGKSIINSTGGVGWLTEFTNDRSLFLIIRVTTCLVGHRSIDRNKWTPKHTTSLCPFKSGDLACGLWGAPVLSCRKKKKMMCCFIFLGLVSQVHFSKGLLFFSKEMN